MTRALFVHARVQFTVFILVTCFFLASFPGPTQLSVTCSASDGKLGGAWERGYVFSTLYY